MRGLAQSAMFSVPSYMHSEVQHPFKAKISETFADEPFFRKLENHVLCPTEYTFCPLLPCISIMQPASGSWAAHPLRSTVYSLLDGTSYCREVRENICKCAEVRSNTTV